jgi:ribosomal protein S18 acetylase RimI-like enzyme
MRLTHEDRTRSFESILRIHDASFSGSERAPRDLLQNIVDTGEVFVRLSGDGEYRCFALLTEKFGEPYIWAIATDPLYRGKGLASSLLDEIAEYVQRNHLHGIGLTTQCDNPAQKLYFDKGYRVRRVLSGYYGLGSDGLFMRREL